jgi:hypothetical protein
MHQHVMVLEEELEEVTPMRQCQITGGGPAAVAPAQDREQLGQGAV